MKVLSKLRLKGIGGENRFKLLQSDNQVIKFNSINLLIGPNNTGKSKFLRAIFEADLRSQEFDIFNNATDKIQDGINEIISSLKIKSSIVISSVAHLDRISGDGINLNFDATKSLISSLEGVLSKKDNLSKIKDTVRMMNLLKDAFLRNNSENINIDYSMPNGSGYTKSSYAYNWVDSEVMDLIDSVTKDVNLFDNFFSNYPTFNYIPIIRGLRPIHQDINVYVDRTIKDYFPTIRERKEKNILSGLEMYDKVDSLLRGSHKDRQVISEYEKFLSHYFFKGEEVLITPRKGSDLIYVKIGKNDEFPIFSFGDGLQSIIIFTFFSFVEKEGSLFFFEEPDVYMHPGMQRTFIDVLQNSVLSKHQYFVTTHSNHLIDISSEFNNTSIFRFNRNREDHQFEIQAVTYQDRILLEDLGVRSSSALISNCCIWVEGVADRLCYKYLFNEYLKEINEDDKYIEDLHYSFLEYQGSNLPHYVFDEDRIDLKFLTPNSFFILDGDVDESKPKWREKLKTMGIPSLILSCKEVESLISSSSLKLIFEAENILPKTREKLLYGDLLNVKTSEGRYESVAEHVFKIAIREGEDASVFRYFSKEEALIKKSEFARYLVARKSLNLNHITRPICEKIYEIVQRFNKI